MPVSSRRLTNRTMNRLSRVVIALILCSLALLPGGTFHAAPAGVSRSTWLRGWLMPGHDPQRTSRSSAVGPAHPHLLFDRPSTSIEAVGPDGAMVGTAQAGSQSLVVDLSRNGRLLWGYPFSGQAVIEPNGTVVAVGFTTSLAGSADEAAGKAYVGSGDGRVRVVSATGRVLARVYAGGYRHGFPPSLLLGPDGQLIVTGTDSTLRVYG